MKRCQVCGTDIEENVKICPICSAEIDEEYVDLYQVYKDAVRISLNKEEKKEVYFTKDSFIKKTSSIDDDLIVKKKEKDDDIFIKKSR